MPLAELQQNWDRFGDLDPFWAILSAPAMKGNRWVPDEFFRTGQEDVRCVLARVATWGLPQARGRALDFGCGVGRLTQAMADHFAVCDGVDIAPSMIRLAQKYNRHGPRCCYHVHARAGLGLFADHQFDFIYSVLVLQHMPPECGKAYIREFLRVLAPDGVAVFQAPSHLTQPAKLPHPETSRSSPLPQVTASPGAQRRSQVRPAEPWGRRAAGLAAKLVILATRLGKLGRRREHECRSTLAGPDAEPRMEMHGIPIGEIHDLVRDHGGTILASDDHPVAGPEWVSFRYFVTKAN